MKKLLFLLTLLLPTSLYAQDVYINAAEVVGFGIFKAKKTNFSAGFRETAPQADNVEGVRFIEFTRDIPASEGLGFGIEYVINTVPKGRPIAVTSTIHFPEPGLVRPNGKTYTTSTERIHTKIGEPTFYGYGFDEDWEMVPGEWVFEIRHKNTLLVKKSFNVYLPETES